MGGKKTRERVQDPRPRPPYSTSIGSAVSASVSRDTMVGGREQSKGKEKLLNDNIKADRESLFEK
jgi:hypothetical protein